MSQLTDRVQRILLSPATEWPVIAAEPATTAGLFRGYVAILAAIGPIAMFLKSTLIGYQIPFGGAWRVDLIDGLLAAAVSYGLSLAAVYVFALIINALAPTFGAQKDPLLALKSAAYAMTAVWIAGIGLLLPLIGGLILLAGAGYGVYLLYLGLPVTMKAPADKVVGFTAVSVVVALVLFWLVAIVAGAVMGRGAWLGGYNLWFGGPVVSQSGRFDEDSALGKLEQWSKNVEEAGKRAEASAKVDGGVPSSAAIGQLMGAVVGGSTSALSTEEIKSFMPVTLAGLPRTSLSAERNAAIGIEVSESKAEYSDGTRSLRLSLNDTGGAKGLLALAAWAGIEQEREWDGGYERDYRADGRMVHERWDAASGLGEYGVIVGGRFAIEISGQAAGVEELKSAVASGIDLAALEARAK